MAAYHPYSPGMASWQMRGLAMLFSVVFKPHLATQEAGRARLARAKGSAEPPRSLRSGRLLERYEVSGFAVHVVHPRTSSQAGAVVYLHGGAYVGEIVSQQWQFVAHLADRTGCPVHVPIYGLAPEHDAAQALALASAVVAELAQAGSLVHLVGDSAGGGLALLAAQHAAPATRSALVGVTALAPWLDLAMANPQIPVVERVDPWLSRAGLVPIAAAWAAGTPLEDPAVSPLHGDFSALPPLAIWVGTRDITLPDCRLVRDRMSGEPSFRYTELQGALHVYALLPVPEGRRARDDIAAHVRTSFQVARER